MTVPITPGEPVNPPPPPVYQQPQYAAAPYYGPPQRKKLNPIVWAVVILVAAGLGFVALQFVQLPTGTSDSGVGDVRVSGCAYDGFANKASVTVTNSGSGTATYFVTVEWDNQGTRVGTDTVIVSDLPAGQSAVQDALAPGQYAADSCFASKVDRG